MFKLSAKKMILGIAAAGSSYVVGGAILDAVSNAVSQITWFATILGTVVTVLLWLALRISLPKYPIRWRNYRVKRLGYYPTCAFIGTALLLWTPPILNRVNYSSNQAEPEVAINNTQKEAKVVVLLADFAGADPGLYGVTKIIEEQLTEVTKDYRDVKIKRLFQSIDTSEVALIKGREAQADIVLWGSYFVNPSHTRVSAHFEVIEKTFEIPLRRDKEVKQLRRQSFRVFHYKNSFPKK